MIVVDPQPFKRQIAGEFGATHTFADIAEATDFARSITNGQGADSAIVTVGVIEGQQIADAFNAIRKAGTVVVTSQGAVAAVGAPINLFEISMYQKRIQGVLYGMTSPRAAVPHLLNMYADGQLKLDELVTKRYAIDDINLAFDDMHNGEVIRGVIDFTTPGAQGGAQ